MGRRVQHRLMVPVLVLFVVQTLTGFTEGAKFRVLALHGLNGNAVALCQTFSTWDQSLLNLVEFDCLNGPLQAENSENAYRWFNYGNRADSNIDGSIAYVLDYMRRNGPYDGILGFSMGGVVAGLVTGVQAKKMVILGRKPGDLPPLRFAILDEAAYMQGLFDEVYDPPVRTKSFHIMGNYEPDANRQCEESFLPRWKNPTVVRVNMPHAYLTGQYMDSTFKWSLDNFLKSQ